MDLNFVYFLTHEIREDLVWLNFFKGKVKLYVEEGRILENASAY